MKKEVSLPPWLLLAGMAVYAELLLHWWTAAEGAPRRLWTVLVFALAFGALLGFFVSLISDPRRAKWAAAITAAVLAVLYFGMYVIFDTYREFLSPGTILSGAGGVAADYRAIALTAVFKNLWRLAVLEAPVICYLAFADAVAVPGAVRRGLALSCAFLYAIGFTAASRIGPANRFDGAVKSFGLHAGITMELLRTASPGERPEFVTAQETVPARVTRTPIKTVYEPQVLPLDFAALAETERDAGIRALHEYVAAQTPSRKNKATGLFAGKNLIFITAEAFSAQVIDPVRTPTLYRLATEGIRFREYHQPAWGGSTTAGEFSNLLGLVPTGGGRCMNMALQQDLFFTVGAALRKQGYHSTAYHNHSYTYYNRDETHTRLGYDEFIAMGNGMEAGVTKNVPESDVEMMEFTVPQFLDRQPFSIYYMTMSGHALYSRGGNAMARKNYHRVEALPYPEPVKCYLAASLELEDALTFLVSQLEETGIADDTVIVLASDHYPYALEKSSTWGNKENYLEDLYGTDNVDRFVRDRSALIIWSGSIEGKNMEVSTPVYSLDILPTLLNLFGVPYDSRLLVGRDVFSDAPPLVLWPDGSWKTETDSFDAATGSFTPSEEEYRKAIGAMVANKITYSENVYKRGYFNALAPLVQ